MSNRPRGKRAQERKKSLKTGRGEEKEGMVYQIWLYSRQGIIKEKGRTKPLQRFVTQQAIKQETRI